MFLFCNVNYLYFGDGYKTEFDFWKPISAARRLVIILSLISWVHIYAASFHWFAMKICSFQRDMFAPLTRDHYR